MEKNVEHRYLAAMAVFRQMYDDRKEVYDIICAFISSYINETRKYTFVLSELVEEVNNYYNFNLPIAIIKSSLKRILGISKDEKSTEKGVYVVDFDIFCSNFHPANLTENEGKNDDIFNMLIAYIEKRKGELKQDEKQILFTSFYDYILDKDSHEKYSELISAFIVENSNNTNLTKQLTEITEGVIIYTGITADVDVTRLGSWNQELTIYLDTEIIFHLAGYNGLFYEQQAKDFINLVKEINHTKEYIHLRYFDNTQKEIDSFFYKAEEIVETHRLFDEKVAMKTIVNGCKKRSDVAIKKTNFNLLLSQYSIKKDENNLYYDDEKNNKYNLIPSNSTEEEIDARQGITYINMLRKGINTPPLSKIKYILITGKGMILKKANDPSIRQSDDIPLATTLCYMTGTFWFKLNKGFGHKKQLTTFYVVNKAKMVLSAILTFNINNKYKELNQQYDDGKITIDQVASAISTFRKESKMPEEIIPSDINYILSLLDESDLERIQNENSLRESKLKETEKILTDKTELLNMKEDVITYVKKENEELKSRLRDLENKELERKMEEIEEEKRNKKNKCIAFLILKIVILLFISIIIFYVLNKYVVSKLPNKWSELLGDLSSIIGLLVMFIPVFKKFIIEKYKKDIDRIDKG